MWLDLCFSVPNIYLWLQENLAVFAAREQYILPKFQLCEIDGKLGKENYLKRITLFKNITFPPTDLSSVSMEIELGDSFWRSFSGLAPDSHSSFHRDGSDIGEDKVKRIIKVSCHVDCGPDCFWQLLCGQFGREPSGMLVLAGKPEVITQKMAFTLRWGAPLFSTLLFVV